MAAANRQLQVAGVCRWLYDGMHQSYILLTEEVSYIVKGLLLIGKHSSWHMEENIGLHRKQMMHSNG